MIVRRECDLKETRCANLCRLDTRASAFSATVTARPRLCLQWLEPTGPQARRADFRAFHHLEIGVIEGRAIGKLGTAQSHFPAGRTHPASGRACTAVGTSPLASRGFESERSREAACSTGLGTAS